jgi:hypothetical protein
MTLTTVFRIICLAALAAMAAFDYATGRLNGTWFVIVCLFCLQGLLDGLVLTLGLSLERGSRE